MEKIKAAVIGCGKVGQLHAKTYINLEGVDFVAVYDSDISRAENYSAQYGVKAYNSIEKMVIESRVAVVSICTPHPLHRAAAISALGAGANVIVEKPLASTLEDCDAIISEAKAQNLQVGTVCQRRFYRPCMRIRKAIDDGKIGTPVLGIVTMLGWRDEAYYKSDPWRGTWKNEGGGVLVNQAPHQIDLLQWFLGPIDTLYGVWSNFNHPYIEVEDTAVAVIKFKSGALGSIVVSNSQNPALYGKVHIFGSNGAAVGVQTDGGAMFIAGMSGITEPPVNDIWTVSNEENMLDLWKKVDTVFFNTVDFMQYYHQCQLSDFIDSVRNKRKPLINAQDGRNTVEIFTAIYRSNRDKKPVKFPLVPEENDGIY